MKIKRLGNALGVLLWGLWLASCDPKTPQPPQNQKVGLYLSMDHLFDTSALVMNQAWLPTSLNQVEINHCQYYLSGFALRRSDSTWLEFPDAVVYADLERELRPRWLLSSTVPAGTYTALRFKVGLDSLRNHSDPASWPPSHPLSLLNSAHMHWNWNTGYIFFKMEGQYQRPSLPINGGFSYHLGGDEMLRSVTLPFAPMTLEGNTADLSVHLRMRGFFDGTHTHFITDSSSFSHSSLGDRVASKLAYNLASAFVWAGVTRP
jgi:hypothetical protein